MKRVKSRFRGEGAVVTRDRDASIAIKFINRPIKSGGGGLTHPAIRYRKRVQGCKLYNSCGIGPRYLNEEGRGGWMDGEM